MNEACIQSKQITGGIGGQKDRNMRVTNGKTQFRLIQQVMLLFALGKFHHVMKVEFLTDNDRLGKVLYALANCPVKPEFRLSYTVNDPEAAKIELLAKAVRQSG